jgi:hypothetical protein
VAYNVGDSYMHLKTPLMALQRLPGGPVTSSA